MTKPITGQNLIGKLAEMFRLSSLRLGLSEVVNITFDGLLLATRQKVASVTLDLQGVAGTVHTAFTVPDGERWYLMDIKNPATTAAKTSCGVVVAGVTITVGLSTTNEVLSQEFDGYELNEGDTVVVTDTGNAGDNARVHTISYRQLMLNQ